ncbi:preprotein translocase [Bacillus cereus group sp. N12]|uniref:preprotein translocase n=1 Tax=Bacillus cereus group sp. N12 TaxID=2794586 RepID=UPI0018F7830D|nr:preprotein translocase [Bacillus cereus group sp. N12]MBJ8079320.1 preprotein translocase [Bacillus cereus group sp. N12]
MANSEMILRLLTDLKIEQQALREQLEKMQTALTILEEKPNTPEEKSTILEEKPNTPEEKSTIIEEKPAVTKQRAYSGRPTSFRDWRASTQKNS